LKLEGRPANAGASPHSIVLDGTGTFAYVLSLNPAAPAVYAYRIDAASGELTPLKRSRFAVAANTIDPVAHWFNAGRCAAFTDVLWSDAHPPPVAKHDADLTYNHAPTPGYFYDPARHVALHYPRGDSGGTITVRVSGEPPAGVPRRDLGGLQTTSGIKLGSSAETVIAALGKPQIITGCNQQRYVYLMSSVGGEPLGLAFTITRGRVTEISEERGG